MDDTVDDSPTCQDIVNDACTAAGNCSSCTTFTAHDVANLRARGWNAIRLGVVWAGAQPRDEDALDPAFAPGTGTPVAGGLTSALALATIWECRELDWRGMDVVEVCPAYDHGEITAIAGASVAQRYLQILAGKMTPRNP